jgi:ankyrin repeat/BTB/POZ domain-containing protein 1
VQFFYTDRLDVAVEDMEDLSRICKVCGCVGLHKAVEKELAHQKFAEYKHMRNADDSQKRFILQGSSLPEHERLPEAMRNLLSLSFMRSKQESCVSGELTNSNKLPRSAAITSETSRVFEEGLQATIDGGSVSGTSMEEDHADVCFSVEESVFRSHKVILAARSDYFRARFSRMQSFREDNVDADSTPTKCALPLLREEDLSSETFEKLLEYMYEINQGSLLVCLDHHRYT